VLLLYHARIESTHVQVTCTYEPTGELLAFGGELRQLFANLVGNAVDAMPGGGRLLIRVSHGRRWDGDESVEGVRVTVADTGHGMTEEETHLRALLHDEGSDGNGAGALGERRDRAEAWRPDARAQQDGCAIGDGVYCLLSV
jgi:signal transduction histidine kinase